MILRKESEIVLRQKASSPTRINHPDPTKSSKRLNKAAHEKGTCPGTPDRSTTQPFKTRAKAKSCDETPQHWFQQIYLKIK